MSIFPPPLHEPLRTLPILSFPDVGSVEALRQGLSESIVDTDAFATQSESALESVTNDLLFQQSIPHNGFWSYLANDDSIYVSLCTALLNLPSHPASSSKTELSTTVLRTLLRITDIVDDRCITVVTKSPLCSPAIVCALLDMFAAQYRPHVELVVRRLFKQNATLYKDVAYFYKKQFALVISQPDLLPMLSNVASVLPHVLVELSHPISVFVELIDIEKDGTVNLACLYINAVLSQQGLQIDLASLRNGKLTAEYQTRGIKYDSEMVVVVLDTLLSLMKSSALCRAVSQKLPVGDVLLGLHAAYLSTQDAKNKKPLPLAISLDTVKIVKDMNILFNSKEEYSGLTIEKLLYMYRDACVETQVNVKDSSSITSANSSSSSSGSSINSSSSSSSSSSVVTSAQVEMITSMFPDIDSTVVKTYLERCKFDVERCVSALLEDPTGAKLKPVSIIKSSFVSTKKSENGLEMTAKQREIQRAAIIASQMRYNDEYDDSLDEWGKFSVETETSAVAESEIVEMEQKKSSKRADRESVDTEEKNNSYIPYNAKGEPSKGGKQKGNTSSNTGSHTGGSNSGNAKQHNKQQSNKDQSAKSTNAKNQSTQETSADALKDKKKHPQQNQKHHSGKRKDDSDK